MGVLQLEKNRLALIAKVHLDPLFADLRNSKAVEPGFCILCQQTLREPLDEYPIHSPERIAVQQVLGWVARKGLSRLQPGGHMVRQLVITRPVESAVSYAVQE